MDSPLGPGRGIRARGAVANPPNRFERISIHADPEFVEWQLQAEPDAPELAGPRTEFFLDPSRQVLSFNASPDLPFAASLNPYRGCEHGCSYCYARPTHEYLGFSAGLDFETKGLVKRAAPALLRQALAARCWKPQVVAIGGVTDPYQPV
ncbi:MAG: radical SAM protein, partial [Deltaproteobacteria bacterium]|nr:radical SAM protein [Deltaproteobacteria bacterium]